MNEGIQHFIQNVVARQLLRHSIHQYYRHSMCSHSNLSQISINLKRLVGLVWSVLGEELCIETTLTVVVFKENCATFQLDNTKVESIMFDLNIKSEVL